MAKNTLIQVGQSLAGTAGSNYQISRPSYQSGGYISGGLGGMSVSNYCGMCGSFHAPGIFCNLSAAKNKFKGTEVLKAKNGYVVTKGDDVFVCLTKEDLLKYL